jgi:hypothetical protein
MLLQEAADPRCGEAGLEGETAGLGRRRQMRPFRPTPPPGGSRGMTPLCRNMGTGGVWQRPLAAGGWRFGTGGKRRQKTLRGRGKNRRGLWATRVHGGQGKQEAREASQAREDSQSPVRDSVEERDPCCLPGRGQYFPFKHNASARWGFVMPVNDTMPGALILRRRISYSENRSKQDKRSDLAAGRIVFPGTREEPCRWRSGRVRGRPGFRYFL